MSIDYSNMAFSKPKIKKHRRETVSEETYNIVFNLCKGKCMLCGTKVNLQLHHILGRGKDLTDNPRYCIMLCNHCHNDVVHKNNKKYRPILLKIRERIGRNESN